ncbi:MAG: hypothetical protein H7Y18_14180 [Clostridiaceae bacterium]|nr:hypothetical protein [Clostridiaceae bacterium]
MYRDEEMDVNEEYEDIRKSKCYNPYMSSPCCAMPFPMQQPMMQQPFQTIKQCPVCGKSLNMRDDEDFDLDDDDDDYDDRFPKSKPYYHHKSKPYYNPYYKPYFKPYYKPYHPYHPYHPYKPYKPYNPYHPYGPWGMKRDFQE